MLGVVLASLGLLLLAGCLDEHVVQPTPVAIERLTPAYGSTSSGLRDYTRVVVRDAASFAGLWERTWPDQPMPDVDFATHTVLVVATGERRTGGYLIRVSEVASTGVGLQATVVTTSPGRHCVVSQAMTQPADFVSVAVAGQGVRFVESQKVERCD